MILKKDQSINHPTLSCKLINQTPTDCVKSWPEPDPTPFLPDEGCQWETRHRDHRCYENIRSAYREVLSIRECLSRIRGKKAPDPGSGTKNLSILNPKIVSKHPRNRIRDVYHGLGSEFFPIPDPRSAARSPAIWNRWMYRTDMLPIGCSTEGVVRWYYSRRLKREKERWRNEETDRSLGSAVQCSKQLKDKKLDPPPPQLMNKKV